MSRVPTMLTVEEAGSILRIGRTAAYALAHQWLDTNGESGLPVKYVGRLLRVPTAQFEQAFAIHIARDGEELAVAGGVSPSSPQPRVHVVPDSPAPTPSRRRRRAGESQDALPFAR